MEIETYLSNCQFYHYNLARNGAPHRYYPLGKASSKIKYFYLGISINAYN